jgi:norsolorinic acid ketoreductase
MIFMAGIGRGFAEAILSRPHTIIVAAVRDPLKKSSQSLLHLDHGASSKLILVKIDSKSETDPADAVRFLQDQSIAHLDVVISNAGISTASSFSTVASVPLATVKEHVEVNCYGPLVLFQAVVPLLQKSKKPVFITIGSRVGSIACMEQMPFPIAAYAPSKAMLHWITRKIHFENEHLISFVISPG